MTRHECKVSDSLTYVWVLLWRDSQTDDRGRFYGHSFYRDLLTGKVSIKDMSGDFPHETDDGVLWLDTSRPVVFRMDSEYMGSRGRASIPVTCVTSFPEKSYCSMLWQDAVKVVREYGFAAQCDEKVLRMAADVLDVVTLCIKERGDA